MYRLLVVVICLFFSLQVVAQEDSLEVISRNDKWVIKHDATLGETVFSIARKYHVPAATLANENGLNYQSGLDDGTDVFVPLGAYNQITQLPPNKDAKPLYYKVGEFDNLYRISKYAGVQQRTMQKWNNLPDNDIEDGQRLFVGWVLYDATPIGNDSKLPEEKNLDNSNNTGKTSTHQDTNPNQSVTGNDTVIVIPKPIDSLSPNARKFLLQTNNGQNVISEKGTAVFFDMGRKISKTRMIYAFHNTASKGTIIKVYNPGNNTVVFAKVLGPIPVTKQYHDAIIGIDDSAKKLLGVSDDRMWSELEYAYR